MQKSIRRGIRLLCAAGITFVAASFAFAHGVQPLLVDSGVDDPSLAWFAFMTRTMTLHAGLGLLVVTGTTLLIKSYRTGWTALVLAVALLAPTLWDARPKSGHTVDETLTIASFNLWARNETPDAALDAILNCGADVVCLQEYTPQWHERCTAALAERYPHRVTDERTGFYGSAIFSRRPLNSNVSLTLGPDHAATTTWVECAGQSVSLWNVHLRHQGYGQSEEVRDLIRQIDAFEPSGAILGDFNFTQYSAEHEAFTATGYRDAFDLAGRGLNTTWPRNRPGAWLMYPGVRIDHVYLSPDLTAKRAWVADTPGSDHAHVVVEIGFAKPEDRR